MAINTVIRSSNEHSYEGMRMSGDEGSGRHNDGLVTSTVMRGGDEHSDGKTVIRGSDGRTVTRHSVERG